MEEGARVNVRLSQEDAAQVALLCARWRLSRTEAIRRAVAEAARWQAYSDALALGLSGLREQMRADVERLEGRIDHLEASVVDGARAEVAPETGAAGPHGQRVPVAGPGAPRPLTARRPGQGVPLAPIEDIVSGREEGIELDMDDP